MRKEVTGIRLVLGYLGIFLIFVGLLTCVPLIALIWYKSEYTVYLNFVIPAGINVVLGLLLYFIFIFKRKKGKIKKFQDSMLLVLIWLAAIITGALPFVFAKYFQGMQMSFSEGFFEAASAYTTTGLTVFKDYVDITDAIAPHVYTLHRSWMQFVGGVGLVLLLASVLGNQANLPLYLSEGHSDKLLPSLGRSAKLIAGIYVFYNILGSLGLWLCGLDWFDAINTSMCALSGGGMSPQSENIAAYNKFEGSKELNGVLPVNPIAIQSVVMVLVIFASISFVLHTFLLKGRFRDFLKDSEIKFAIANFCIIYIVLVFSSFFSYANINSVRYFNEEGVRLSFNALFYYINSTTNSGFMNTTLPEMVNMGRPVIYLLIFVMLIGGGMGSTAGGIKKYRVMIDVKYILVSIHYKFAPAKQMYPLTVFRYGKTKEITHSDTKEAFNYTFIFMVIFGVCLAILCFLPKMSLQSSAFTLASAISNTGLGYIEMDGTLVDIVGYCSNFPSEGNVFLWVCSIAMILGRLEIFPLLYGARCLPEVFKEHKVVSKRKANLNRAELSQIIE